MEGSWRALRHTCFMFWHLPGTLLMGMGAFGVVLLVLLLWHYLWARGTSASV